MEGYFLKIKNHSFGCIFTNKSDTFFLGREGGGRNESSPCPHSPCTGRYSCLWAFSLSASVIGRGMEKGDWPNARWQMSAPSRRRFLIWGVEKVSTPHHFMESISFPRKCLEVYSHLTLHPNFPLHSPSLLQKSVHPDQY